MPHHRNGRTRRDGVICAEPSSSASAWLTRWQADHGRRRSLVLTWERGEVASVIYCTATGKACTCTCLYAELFFFFDSKWSTTPPRPTIRAGKKKKPRFERRTCYLFVSLDSQDSNKVGNLRSDRQ